MTGYGKSESQFRGKKLICEIRSLNSKSVDMSIRLLPSFLRAHELDIRTMVAKRAERGKIDLAVYTQESMQSPDSPATALTPVNWDAVKIYADQYKTYTGSDSVPPEVMAAILRFPDVLKVQEDASDLTDD